MSGHFLNLGLRFLLELTALVTFGYWGWQSSESWLRYLFSVGMPILAAIVWGVFAVPVDPSRSGKAPVVIPGWVRLILEFLILGMAGMALFNLNANILGWLYSLFVIGHYLFSLDRVKWLLSR